MFVTYAILIKGLCRIGQLNKVTGVLEEMKSKGVIPHVDIYNVLMDFMCKVGQLKEAADIFSILQANGLQPNCRTYGILIKGLCKKGLMSEATKLLRKMEEHECFPNDCTYNIIIRGFILGNDIPNALHYRDVMVSKGFAADVDTIELVTNLLAHDSSKELLQKFIS